MGRRAVIRLLRFDEMQNKILLRETKEAHSKSRETIREQKSGTCNSKLIETTFIQDTFHVFFTAHCSSGLYQPLGKNYKTRALAVLEKFYCPVPVIETYIKSHSFYYHNMF